jgi:hypothetical protein
MEAQATRGYKDQQGEHLAGLAANRTCRLRQVSVSFSSVRGKRWAGSMARVFLGAGLAMAALISPTSPVINHQQPSHVLAADCLEAVMAEGASEWDALGFCAAALGNSDVAVLAYRAAVGLAQATGSVVDGFVDVVDEVVAGDLEGAVESGAEATNEAEAVFDAVVGFVQVVFSDPGRISDARDLRAAAAAERERQEQNSEEAQEALIAIILSKCPPAASKNSRIAKRTEAVKEALSDGAPSAPQSSEGYMEYLISAAWRLLQSSESNVCSERSAPARPTATPTPQRAPGQPRVAPIRPAPTRTPLPDQDSVPPRLTR